MKAQLTKKARFKYLGTFFRISGHYPIKGSISLLSQTAQNQKERCVTRSSFIDDPDKAERNCQRSSVQYNGISSIIGQG
jgi:hypothetical protein